MYGTNQQPLYSSSVRGSPMHQSSRSYARPPQPSPHLQRQGQFGLPQRSYSTGKAARRTYSFYHLFTLIGVVLLL